MSTVAEKRTAAQEIEREFINPEKIMALKVTLLAAVIDAGLLMAAAWVASLL